MASPSPQYDRTPFSLTPAADWGRALWFALCVLLVTRLGTFVPVPGLDPSKLAQLRLDGSGALSRLSIFSLGLMPFVSAWMLVEVFRGDRTQAHAARIRRKLTAAFALFQALGIARSLEQVNGLVIEPGVLFVIATTLTLTAGTLLLLWLGEQITRSGLCDGVWLIVASSFLADLPRNLSLAALNFPVEIVAVAVACFAGLTALAVLVELAWLHLPLEGTAKAGDRLSLKLERVTVLPAYLATFTLGLQAAISAHWSAGGEVFPAQGAPNTPNYLAVYAITLLIATFLATAAVVSPRRTARELERNGARIVGAPGIATAAYLDRILTRHTVIVAAFMIAFLIVPHLLILFFGVPVYFVGPSLLVVVIVMLDILDRARGVLISAPSA